MHLWSDGISYCYHCSFCQLVGRMFFWPRCIYTWDLIDPIPMPEFTPCIIHLYLYIHIEYPDTDRVFSAEPVSHILSSDCTVFFSHQKVHNKIIYFQSDVSMHCFFFFNSSPGRKLYHRELGSCWIRPSAFPSFLFEGGTFTNLSLSRKQLSFCYQRESVRSQLVVSRLSEGIYITLHVSHLPWVVPMGNFKSWVAVDGARLPFQGSVHMNGPLSCLQCLSP